MKNLLLLGTVLSSMMKLALGQNSSSSTMASSSSSMSFSTSSAGSVLQSCATNTGLYQIGLGLLYFGVVLLTFTSIIHFHNCCKKISCSYSQDDAEDGFDAEDGSDVDDSTYQASTEEGYGSDIENVRGKIKGDTDGDASETNTSVQNSKIDHAAEYTNSRPSASSEISTQCCKKMVNPRFVSFVLGMISLAIGGDSLRNNGLVVDCAASASIILQPALFFTVVGATVMGSVILEYAARKFKGDEFTIKKLGCGSLFSKGEVLVTLAGGALVAAPFVSAAVP